MVPDDTRGEEEVLYRNYWFLLELGKAVEVVKGVTVRVLCNSRRSTVNCSASYHAAISVLLGTTPLRTSVPYDWTALVP